MSGRPVSTRVANVAAAAAIAAVFLGACLAGSANSNVTVRSGTAYVTDYQASIIGDGDGWVYDLPSNVSWTDSSGTWHEGGQPSCLPDAGKTGPVKFAATEVTVNGFTWRPVVWISCQDSRPR